MASTVIGNLADGVLEAFGITPPFEFPPKDGDGRRLAEIQRVKVLSDQKVRPKQQLFVQQNPDLWQVCDKQQRVLGSLAPAEAKGSALLARSANPCFDGFYLEIAWYEE